MATVDITTETRGHLVAIGRAHGAAEGREMSQGVRVAAKYHERLVEVLKIVGADCAAARALLKEIEEAHKVLNAGQPITDKQNAVKGDQERPQ